jgi:exo-1,4-beta-D-glucosaminidase
MSWLASALVALAAHAADVTLREGWSIQSSAHATDAGAVISKPGYQATGWYSVTVPCSVVGGLLQNHVYAEPFYGRNLDHIDPKTFAPAWWYRKEFEVPGRQPGQRVWLHLEGVNYRADVWLNGTLLADDHTLAGPFRAHDFDVTDRLAATGPNALAVQVFKVTDINRDLAIHFVDWNPPPPDMNLGILNDVVLSTTGPVRLRHPLVTTQLDLPSLDTAHLTVVAEVTNASDRPVAARVSGAIGDVKFAQQITLAAHALQRVTFRPQEFPQLNLAHPALWWPWEYGTPALQTLTLDVSADGTPSDRQAVQFGIRQITSKLNAAGTRVFAVNGKPILIRGAAWTPDLFQRRSPERQETEIRYARDLNLNTLRFEGKFEDQHLFDLADQYGFLVMIGWCCCDAWQDSEHWNTDQLTVACESLRTQMYRLRHHASMLAWFNGSDELPTPTVEKRYLDIEADLQWPNPIVNCASARTSPISGPSGVKMEGPYEWEPPIYWETDTKHKFGGAWNFATEISPGPAVPPLESLVKFIPADELWPIGDAWYFHCGGGSFHDLNVFTDALNRRYGPANSAADYAKKAQVAAYEAHRAMFEAYGRHKYEASGVIQWMMNNAWPSMIWHLYDYYLRAGGSYYGVKNALEPLHIQYSYADRMVSVVNSTLRPYAGLKATVRICDLDGVERYTHEVPVPAIAADAVVESFRVPEVPGLSDTYFLQLRLTDGNNADVSRTTYWLSLKPEAIAWEQKKPVFQYTPQATFADFRALERLAPAKLTATEQVRSDGAEVRDQVTLHNVGATVAFFVHVELTQGAGGEEILPVFWQDNYVTLLPGETRVVEARYRAADAKGSKPTLKVDAYNTAAPQR